MQEYIQIDRQLHQLSQVIAKFNRTFIPKRDDDSHTNIYYDHLVGRIIGRWAESKSGKINLALNLDENIFELIDQNQSGIAKIQITDNQISNIESELEARLVKLGLDTEGLRDKLHFEIPDYDQNDPCLALSNSGVQKWRQNRDTANQLCQLLIGHFQQGSEARIWPHHFDTGVYIQATPNIGIGLGLAMEDSMVGAPYYYLTDYSSEGKINFSKLPEIDRAKWIVNDNWKGAVLPLTTIEDQTSKSWDIGKQFIASGLNWYLGASHN